MGRLALTVKKIQPETKICLYRTDYYSLSLNKVRLVRTSKEQDEFGR